MSVHQVRELVCDCTEPGCRPQRDVCGEAIVDYASSVQAMRNENASAGWSVGPGGWPGRDYCPACTKHRVDDPASSSVGVGHTEPEEQP